MTPCGSARQTAGSRWPAAEPAEPTRGELVKQQVADCGVRAAIGAAESMLSIEGAASRAAWECQGAIGSLLGGLFGR